MALNLSDSLRLTLARGTCQCHDTAVSSFFHRRPAPPLDQFVESVWICHNETGRRRFERVQPSGAAQLVINLAEDQTRVYQEGAAGLVCVTGPGSILTGLTSHAQIIDTDEQAYVAGIAFRPGGTVPFAMAAAHELTDVDVPLDAVWGEAATRRLREQLLDALTPEAALDILEQALLLASTGRRCHPAVAFALNRFRARPSHVRVSDVTAAVGLSAKRFIERFKAEVGVTPKRYCRLLRFQQTVAVAHRLCSAEWAALAASCGYVDQAHFIHEFREFSGITPGTYERQRTTFQNHVTFLQSDRV